MDGDPVKEDGLVGCYQVATPGGEAGEKGAPVGGVGRAGGRDDDVG